MAVRAVLSANSLHVEPGAEVVATVAIRNTGEVVDRFHVEVLGDAAQWATVTPPNLPLFPNAEGSVTVSFRPKRSPTALAGTWPFGVRIASEVDPRSATVEEGTLEIDAFTQLNAELSPQISHGRRVGRHQIACDNYGNTPLRLTFAGADPENTLRFRFRPAIVVAQPGTATVVRLGVRPRRRYLTGQAKTHEFRIVVQAKDAPPASLSGSMVQTALAPKWLFAVVAPLIALLVVAAVLLIPPAKGTSGHRLPPTPPPTLAASFPPPTPTPTPSPSDTLSAGQTIPSSVQSLQSNNGHYQAVLQSNGNLTVLNEGTPIWSSTGGQPGDYLIMQEDGNLVIYSPPGPPGHALWASNTPGIGQGAYLVMQSDGDLVIYSSTGTAVWRSISTPANSPSGHPILNPNPPVLP